MKNKDKKETRSRGKQPLFVFKMSSFTWIAACRRCWNVNGYYSHPLALQAAIDHHTKCPDIPSAQTCS